MDVLLISGIVMLVIGGGLGISSKRRKFYRTNTAGIEQFPSYFAKVRSKFFDGMLDVFAITFLACGLLAVAYVYKDSWGWIVLLPFSALMLLVLL